MAAKLKKTLIKNINRIYITNFSKLQIISRKRLLQELGEEVHIIMLNPDKSEICRFTTFIWEQHHQLALVTNERLIH